MTAIRPPLQSILFPTQSSAMPARASRSDFFRAALQGATEAGQNRVDTEQVPDLRVDATPERYPRPGALLDIRV